MKRLLIVLLALFPTGAVAQSAPLIFKQGHVAQAAASDTLSVPGPFSVNAADLGNQVNVVATTGRNMGFFSSPNNSTAPWFVLRDAYTGTRGVTGIPGDGNGPHLVFQSANSLGVFKDSAAINCGLIKATSGAEKTDCDYVGLRNGAIEIMFAMDAARPALVPGVDNVYQLGDLALGGSHALNRFSFGYFSQAVCVGCSSAIPTDPLQAIVANNSNAGVFLASAGSSVRLVGSLANAAYNGIVSAGDVGLIANLGGSIVVAPQYAGSGGSRWSSDGTLTQTGALVVAGSAGRLQLPPYTVATLPSCVTGIKGSMAYVTDATAPTYNGALTGGGAVVVPVFCNGASWTSH